MPLHYEAGFRSDICTGCRCTHGSPPAVVPHAYKQLHMDILRDFVLAERFGMEAFPDEPLDLRRLNLMMAGL